ncbi:MAG: hypothetical protein JST54_23300 [Deltaproteobacteria bacterium]|nr:hypothetical protein [Deltaproteobacteria bacterium]
MTSRYRSSLFVLLGLIAVSGCNCGKAAKLTHAPEDYDVEPGSPEVAPDLPVVDANSQPPPVTYAINVPRQCDIFTQNTVRKVDIMWVIQNSGSMASHQAQLANNFSGFINFLLSADPPIDFHIGVVTTDTDDPNESGTLHNWGIPDPDLNSAVDHPLCNGISGFGLAGSFIQCTPPTDGGPTLCNTDPDETNTSGSVQCAFNEMSAVGTRGSSHQRGLYASYLALNRPENVDTGAGTNFIRPDAALYVVYVGSEDDLSCSPTVGNPLTDPNSGGTCNTVDPECKCQPDAQLQWGGTAFFERFLSNYKGYGHSDLVAAAAVVATEHNSVPQFSTAPYPGVGCSSGVIDPNTNQPIEAFYGQRYIEVAQATGGAATSICASDFNDALNRLGFAVSGLRRDFKLSRGPSTQTIEVYVSPRNALTCTTDQECATDPDGYNSCQAGHCSKLVQSSLQPLDTGAEYIQCDNGVLRNTVEFGADAVPPAEGTVEVCYDVDAHFNSICQ